ncbi:MAG: hypothetical protein ACRDSS_04205 [Actinocrinis sp.]
MSIIARRRASIRCGDFADRARPAKGGVPDDYVTKPFSMDELMAAYDAQTNHLRRLITEPGMGYRFQP